MAYSSKHYETALSKQTKVVIPTTSYQTVTPDSDKKLSSVIVSAIQTESRTTKSNGTITPSAGKFLSSVTVSVPVYDGSLIPAGALPIGGKIFYINEDATPEVTYTFYDHNCNVISNPTLANLYNAEWYSISGTAAEDKYYIFNQDSIADTDYHWGFSTSDNINDDFTTLGESKYYCNHILNTGIPTDCPPNIWQYLSNCNTNSFCGCNDWFIGGYLEYNLLQESGVSSLFDIYDMWNCNGLMLRRIGAVAQRGVWLHDYQEYVWPERTITEFTAKVLLFRSI